MTVRGDVQDASLVGRVVNEYEIEVVFHLAAQTVVGAAQRSPVGSFDSNVRGTWVILDAARTSPSVRAVVVSSSDKAYGEQPVLPYTESMPLLAQHPYDVSKACADMLTRSYHSAYGIPTAVTRCGNLYGGGDLNFSRVVPGTIRAAILGSRPVIRSDGSPVRDYLFVEDAAAACLRLAERLSIDPSIGGQAFNFSAEEPTTVSEIANRILAMMGSELQLDVRDDSEHEIQRQFLDSTKARTLLDWVPTKSSEAALQQTIDWYREYFHDFGG